METESGMVFKPCTDFLPMVRGDIVEHHMNGGYGSGSPGVDIFQKSNEFTLALAIKGPPIYLAGAGIEGPEQLKSALASILVLHSVGDISRFRRFGRL